MTVLVGILCTDGVVVAADSAMTFGAGPGQFTIAHTARKIDIVSKQAIVAGTGQVGLGQRFKVTVEGLWTGNKLKGDEVERTRTIAQAALLDHQSTSAPRGQFGALAAIPMSGGRFVLCEFATADFQPELKTTKCCYVSMGSGQSLADPFLALMRDVFWKSGPPSVKGGKFAATWVMHHAIKYAPGFVAPPIDLAVLDKDGARLLDERELQEHLTMVEEADKHLADFGGRLSSESTTVPPTLPALDAPSSTPPTKT